MSFLQVPVQGLVGPAPDPGGTLETVAALVDDLRDPHAHVEPQPEETALQEHVPPHHRCRAAVDRMQDSGFGELVVPDHLAGERPGPTLARLADGLLPDDRPLGVAMPTGCRSRLDSSGIV